MKDIVFKEDCEFNEVSYFKGDVIELSSIKYDDLKKIWSLNEKGLIEPISYKDFIEFSRTLKNPKKENRKDEING